MNPFGKLEISNGIYRVIRFNVCEMVWEICDNIDYDLSGVTEEIDQLNQEAGIIEFTY